VAEGFDIQIYGNYPNPFQDYTVFSFLIIANDILDKFTISIYTVAGRKIREINRPQGSDEIWDPGYHEIEWDGRDQDGAMVANGVYFAMIKADLKGKTYEQTMKVARLR
jgi:flagellar hook assembly protein FlgD